MGRRNETTSLQRQSFSHNEQITCGLMVSSGAGVHSAVCTVFHQFFCCIKGMEIWQEINSPVSQLVFSNRMRWVWLHLISDCCQFSIVSLVEFNKNLHDHRFTLFFLQIFFFYKFYQLSTIGLAEFSESFYKSDDLFKQWERRFRIREFRFR